MLPASAGIASQGGRQGTTRAASAGFSDRLPRVAPLARLAQASSPSPGDADAHALLFGRDSTTGIVSVDADLNGRARVWRRVGDQVERTDHAFPNWFLVTSLELLAHLSAEQHTADWWRASHGQVTLTEPLAVVELDSDTGEDVDAYRFLVLTTSLAEVETALVETANKRDGSEATSLGDLRGLVLMWHPIEQFLTLTGRTYFKGMPFSALRRFQFDLETTGLNEDRDRIFMISLGDSSGWRDCLDTTVLNEADMISRFVKTVQSRDPDPLENHNIFGFDMSFLVKRAARLGVPLAIGRDGSEPWLETDVFDGGERPEPFLRWRVAGREVIDTQHAVRRYGLAAPDMRRHGLKDAARYFGFARSDREYVPGAEIWSTYRADPERIRRYASDDVDEVDGLSRRLLPATFDLATMLPRTYERIAADTGAAALWELLLVRAYLQQGRAISAPTPRLLRPNASPKSELFIRGVIGPAMRTVVSRLLPCVLAERSTAATNDALSLMPRVLKTLLEQPDGLNGGAAALAAAAHGYLASPGLFSDPQAANEASSTAREYLDRVIREAVDRGCRAVGIDGEQIVFGIPSNWGPALEAELANAARTHLPSGVELGYIGHYDSLYTRSPGATITLGPDDAVTLIGPAFRAGRLERFGESFMRQAAAFALRADAAGLRQVFLHTVHLLRTCQIALEELSVQVTLHKSLAQYRRGGTHEEPYEVLLAAGIRSWRVGQRIRYFRARGGEPRLLQEGDGASALDADAEYYVQRLTGLYCQQFAHAFTRDDFARIFRLPAGDGPFEEAHLAASLADIKTIATPVTPTAAG